MKHSIYSLLLVALLVINVTGCQHAAAENSNARSSATSEDRVSGGDGKRRAFELNYGATITGLPAEAKVCVWFPVAESNEQQSVSLLNARIPNNAEMQTHRDDVFGNQIGYFELVSTEPGEAEFEIRYDVIRHEASVDGAQSILTDEQKKVFLSASSLIPLNGKPQQLIKSTNIPAEPLAASKALYDVVGQHMKYDKSLPGYGNGDAEWACDSQMGNCTDFHSLFISLARSKSIPARFEIGFPIPSDKNEGPIGGYHCWAWFHVDGKGWSPVDISEADKHPELKEYYFGKLTADRVSFSSGRDIVLKPQSAGGPLNYFVYPYVEVDGKAWPKEKIQTKFSFKNK